MTQKVENMHPSNCLVYAKSEKYYLAAMFSHSCPDIIDTLAIL